MRNSSAASSGALLGNFQRRRYVNKPVPPFSCNASSALPVQAWRRPLWSPKPLHFLLGQERLHPAFAALLWELNAGGKPRGYQISMANALWGQKGYSFRNEFLTGLQTNYGAGLNEVDFIATTEQARTAINSWVQKQTRDRIKDLIKPGTLDADTRLVLTNAIYFKGNWDVQFKKERTMDAPFLGISQKINVPLMYEKGKFKYLQGDNFQALAQPYVGKDLSMVVLLPEKLNGLKEFEKTPTEAKLRDWLSRMHEVELDVRLPKFKMTEEFDLRQVLSELGMPLAFEPGAADFSGMNGGKERLYISDVVHKAFVEVNEEGTEAAAATGAIFTTVSGRIGPAFRADHPFIFLIRDNRSGAILFLGRLVHSK